MSRPNSEPVRARLALLPGLIGAIVLIAALALIGGDWYIWVRFVVAILALIMCVFAYQGKSYWWFIGLVPVAVVFNPVWPLPIGDLWLRLLHLAGAIVFIAAGISIKVPVEESRKGPAGRYDGKGRQQSGPRGSGPRPGQKRQGR
jgi:hypothetical protein